MTAIVDPSSRTKSIDPPTGRTSDKSKRTKVVFPTPVSPRMAVTLPGAK